MTIHKEGTATISLVALVVGLLNIANFSYLYPVSAIAAWAVFIILLGFFLFIVSSLLQLVFERISCPVSLSLHIALTA